MLVGCCLAILADTMVSVSKRVMLSCTLLSLHPCLTWLSAEYRCKLAGAQRNSFPSVVAGGADAGVIHYLRNDKVAPQANLPCCYHSCIVHRCCDGMTPVSMPATATQHLLLLLLHTLRLLKHLTHLQRDFDQATKSHSMAA